MEDNGVVGTVGVSEVRIHALDTNDNVCIIQRVVSTLLVECF
jgi:hypothetical protein